jgi:hypothetical protein
MRSATALVKLFEQNGFTLARAKNHLVWHCPCGHAMITTGKTGSDCRGGHNASAQIRRTLKACNTQEENTP